MIPLKLETLFAGRVVEQNRVEYKKGWNPNDTIQTICAFANDFSNTNGGYIVIGVEAENGRPILPPVGIDENDLDRIQQELFRFCNFIEPRYLPQSEIIEYQGKKLIYLWCSGGDAGPYEAPTDVYGKSKKKRQSEYWIKVLSIKTAARDSEKFDLFNKFNSVPYDDCVNREATVDAIRRAYVEDHLADSNSALLSLRSTASTEDILLALEAAKATDTGIAIRNVGLLMFALEPERFIPQAITELKWFYTLDEEGGDFEELTFTGPLQNQIREVLNYIKTSFMAERVVKLSQQAEALRFFNYTHASLEETLVNAHLHRRYDRCDPVQVRIYPNRIVIGNTPGPDFWVDMDKFRRGEVVAMRYRNRRVGEFLKAIDLSEKSSTGITKILLSLEQNGSPAPEFETNDTRDYLLTTIKMHEAFEPIVRQPVIEVEVDQTVSANSGDANAPVNAPVNDVSNAPVNAPVSIKLNKSMARILEYMADDTDITLDMLAQKLSVDRSTVRRNIKKLQEISLVKRTGSDKTGYWTVSPAALSVLSTASKQ